MPPTYTIGTTQVHDAEAFQRHMARSSITPRDGHQRTPLVLHSRSTTPKLQQHMSRSSITPRDGHGRTRLVLHRSTTPKLQRHMARSSITSRDGHRCTPLVLHSTVCLLCLETFFLNSWPILTFSGSVES